MTQQDNVPTSEPNKASGKFTISLGIGILLGVGWGLFFGEQGAWIKWAGDSFVGLLQMTVLPYVAVSLICHLGRLSRGEGGRLARVSLSVLLVLWLIGFLTLAAAQWCFPPWKGGSFFSTSLVNEPEQIDWMQLFIPANIFYSLANNLVPAVVLFSIGFGIALRSVPGRARVLEQFDVILEGLGRLNKLVVRFSPLGIFAIVAHTSGTLSMEQFGLLQGYLLVYAVASLLLCFLILPSLIACCTPLTQRQVIRECGGVMIAAFVIGNTFAVLPLLIEAVERLMQASGSLQDSGSRPPREENSPGYTIQLAYPFPDVGRILGLLFIPFAAWFYGTSLESSQVGPMIAAGFVGSFGKLVVAIPMLLDMAELPSDIFSLFLAVGVIAGRFGDLCKSMHLVSFSILTACWLSGSLRLNRRRLLASSLTTAAIGVVCIVGIRGYLALSFEDQYGREDLLVERELLADPVESTILPDTTVNTEPLRPGEDPLERILRRGIVRIGFESHALPFSYFDRDGNLIGLDVEMAYQLARDLGVAIEFVPHRGDIINSLREDHCDIAMSGLEGTVTRAIALPEMDSYLQVTRALAVPDYSRGLFKSVSSMKAHFGDHSRITVAVIRHSIASESLDEVRRDQLLGSGAAVVQAAGLLPLMDVVELDNARAYFESDPPIADCLVVSAEVGSAWTLQYPGFTVVRPEGFSAKSSLHYFVAKESRLRDFVNSWLQIKRLDGTIDQLFDYWILGNDFDRNTPRWCIMRDVLHWVD